MKRFELCPVCGGNLMANLVTKVLRGGGYTVYTEVDADVCLQCGERFYTLNTIEAFQRIRAKLKHQGMTEKPTSQVSLWMPDLKEHSQSMTLNSQQ